MARKLKNISIQWRSHITIKWKRKCKADTSTKQEQREAAQQSQSDRARDFPVSCSPPGVLLDMWLACQIGHHSYTLTNYQSVCLCVALVIHVFAISPNDVRWQLVYSVNVVVYECVQCVCLCCAVTCSQKRLCICYMCLCVFLIVCCAGLRVKMCTLIFHSHLA